VIDGGDGEPKLLRMRHLRFIVGSIDQDTVFSGPAVLLVSGTA
jgi:hypothetical protein